LGALIPPMSLKAKVEAVVYAAEEPVTLAQLAGIFAAEVLQGLSEAASEQASAEPETEQIALEEMAPEATPEDASAGEGAVSPEGEDASVKPDAGEAEEKKAARLRDRQVRQVLQQVLDELIADYANSERGMEIREIAGGYRMATKPEYHDAVRGFVKSLKPPMKLSLQALETLAVIAYKQPVTAPEVSEIRGVDSGGVLGSLVSRKLITTAGRKPVIGRPILYKTTKEFLLRFGLKDVNDLPSMEEFEKMAGELAEAEAEGETQDASNLAVAEASTDAQPSGEAEPAAKEGVAAEPAEAEAEGETQDASNLLAAETSADAQPSGEAEPTAEEGVAEQTAPESAAEPAEGDLNAEKGAEEASVELQTEPEAEHQV
jgi:segregation and condensation protein B